MIFLYGLHIELNSRFYRDLRDSFDGSAFNLYLACISFISIMVAKLKEAIVHFDRVW